MWCTVSIVVENWRHKTETWDSRKEAADFYLRAIAGSEGSECERYTKIYTELLMGKEVCNDEY